MTALTQPSQAETVRRRCRHVTQNPASTAPSAGTTRATTPVNAGQVCSNVTTLKIPKHVASNILMLSNYPRKSLPTPIPYQYSNFYGKKLRHSCLVLISFSCDMTSNTFQDSKAATARSTSMSAAATPACTEACALRGRGRPSMAASLCCRSATSSRARRATSAAVLQEQQVRIHFVTGVQ